MNGLSSYLLEILGIVHLTLHILSRLAILISLFSIRYQSRANNGVVDISPASYFSVIHAGVRSFILTSIFL